MLEFLAEGEWGRRLISSKMAAISCKLRRVWTVWSCLSRFLHQWQWILPGSLKCSPSAGQGWFAAPLEGHHAVNCVKSSIPPSNLYQSLVAPGTSPPAGYHFMSYLVWRERKKGSSSNSNTPFPWNQQEWVIQSPKCYLFFCWAPLSPVHPLLTAHRAICAVLLAHLSKSNQGFIATSLTSDNMKFTEGNGVPHFASSLNSSCRFFSLGHKGEGR